MKKNFVIAILLINALDACAISQPDTACSPLIVEGKLIVDDKLIVSSCGIVIAPRDNKAGTP